MAQYGSKGIPDLYNILKEGKTFQIGERKFTIRNKVWASGLNKWHNHRKIFSYQGLQDRARLLLERRKAAKIAREGVIKRGKSIAPKTSINRESNILFSINSLAKKTKVRPFGAIEANVCSDNVEKCVPSDEWIKMKNEASKKLEKMGLRLNPEWTPDNPDVTKFRYINETKDIKIDGKRTTSSNFTTTSGKAFRDMDVVQDQIDAMKILDELQEKVETRQKTAIPVCGDKIPIPCIDNNNKIISRDMARQHSSFYERQLFELDRAELKQLESEQLEEIKDLKKSIKKTEKNIKKRKKRNLDRSELEKELNQKRGDLETKINKRVETSNKIGILKDARANYIEAKTYELEEELKMAQDDPGKQERLRKELKEVKKKYKPSDAKFQERKRAFIEAKKNLDKGKGYEVLLASPEEGNAAKEFDNTFDEISSNGKEIDNTKFDDYVKRNDIKDAATFKEEMKAKKKWREFGDTLQNNEIPVEAGSSMNVSTMEVDGKMKYVVDGKMYDKIPKIEEYAKPQMDTFKDLDDIVKKKTYDIAELSDEMQSLVNKINADLKMDTPIEQTKYLGIRNIGIDPKVTSKVNIQKLAALRNDMEMALYKTWRECPSDCDSLWKAYNKYKIQNNMENFGVNPCAKAQCFQTYLTDPDGKKLWSTLQADDAARAGFQQFAESKNFRKASKDFKRFAQWIDNDLKPLPWGTPAVELSDMTPEQLEKRLMAWKPNNKTYKKWKKNSLETIQKARKQREQLDLAIKNSETPPVLDLDPLPSESRENLKKMEDLEAAIKRQTEELNQKKAELAENQKKLSQQEIGQSAREQVELKNKKKKLQGDIKKTEGTLQRKKGNLARAKKSFERYRGNVEDIQTRLKTFNDHQELVQKESARKGKKIENNIERRQQKKKVSSNKARIQAQRTAKAQAQKELKKLREVMEMEKYDPKAEETYIKKLRENDLDAKGKAKFSKIKPEPNQMYVEYDPETKEVKYVERPKNCKGAVCAGKKKPVYTKGEFYVSQKIPTTRDAEMIAIMDVQDQLKTEYDANMKQLETAEEGEKVEIRKQQKKIQEKQAWLEEKYTDISKNAEVLDDVEVDNFDYNENVVDLDDEFKKAFPDEAEVSRFTPKTNAPDDTVRMELIKKRNTKMLCGMPPDLKCLQKKRTVDMYDDLGVKVKKPVKPPKAKSQKFLLAAKKQALADARKSLVAAFDVEARNLRNIADSGMQDVELRKKINARLSDIEKFKEGGKLPKTEFNEADEDKLKRLLDEKKADVDEMEKTLDKQKGEVEKVDADAAKQAEQTKALEDAAKKADVPDSDEIKNLEASLEKNQKQLKNLEAANAQKAANVQKQADAAANVKQAKYINTSKRAVKVTTKASLKAAKVVAKFISFMGPLGDIYDVITIADKIIKDVDRLKTLDENNKKYIDTGLDKFTYWNCEELCERKHGTKCIGWYENSSKPAHQYMMESIGEGAGTGAGLGATVGGVAGPLGSLVGAFVGAGVGALVGWIASQDNREVKNITSGDCHVPARNQANNFFYFHDGYNPWYTDKDGNHCNDYSHMKIQESDKARFQGKDTNYLEFCESRTTKAACTQETGHNPTPPVSIASQTWGDHLIWKRYDSPKVFINWKDCFNHGKEPPVTNPSLETMFKEQKCYASGPFYYQDVKETKMCSNKKAECESSADCGGAPCVDMTTWCGVFNLKAEGKVCSGDNMLACLTDADCREQFSGDCISKSFNDIYRGDDICMKTKGGSNVIRGVTKPLCPVNIGNRCDMGSNVEWDSCSHCGFGFKDSHCCDPTEGCDYGTKDPKWRVFQESMGRKGDEVCVRDREVWTHCYHNDCGTGNDSDALIRAECESLGMRYTGEWKDCGNSVVRNSKLSGKGYYTGRCSGGLYNEFPEYFEDPVLGVKETMKVKLEEDYNENAFKNLICAHAQRDTSRFINECAKHTRTTCLPNRDSNFDCETTCNTGGVAKDSPPTGCATHCNLVDSSEQDDGKTKIINQAFCESKNALNTACNSLSITRNTISGGQCSKHNSGSKSIRERNCLKQDGCKWSNNKCSKDQRKSDCDRDSRCNIIGGSCMPKDPCPADKCDFDKNNNDKCTGKTIPIYKKKYVNGFSCEEAKRNCEDENEFCSWNDEKKSCSQLNDYDASLIQYTKYTNPNEQGEIINTERCLGPLVGNNKIFDVYTHCYEDDGNWEEYVRFECRAMGLSYTDEWEWCIVGGSAGKCSGTVSRDAEDNKILGKLTSGIVRMDPVKGGKNEYCTDNNTAFPLKKNGFRPMVITNWAKYKHDKKTFRGHFTDNCAFTPDHAISDENRHKDFDDMISWASSIGDWFRLNCEPIEGGSNVYGSNITWGSHNREEFSKRGALTKDFGCKKEFENNRCEPYSKRNCVDTFDCNTCNTGGVAKDLPPQGCATHCNLVDSDIVDVTTKETINQAFCDSKNALNDACNLLSTRNTTSAGQCSKHNRGSKSIRKRNCLKQDGCKWSNNKCSKDQGKSDCDRDSRCNIIGGSCMSKDPCPADKCVFDNNNCTGKTKTIDVYKKKYQTKPGSTCEEAKSNCDTKKDCLWVDATKECVVEDSKYAHCVTKQIPCSWQKATDCSTITTENACNSTVGCTYKNSSCIREGTSNAWCGTFEPDTCPTDICKVHSTNCVANHTLPEMCTPNPSRGGTALWPATECALQAFPGDMSAMKPNLVCRCSRSGEKVTWDNLRQNYSFSRDSPSSSTSSSSGDMGGSTTDSNTTVWSTYITT